MIETILSYGSAIIIAIAARNNDYQEEDMT